jgi:hypothetical protein
MVGFLLGPAFGFVYALAGLPGIAIVGFMRHLSSRSS